MRIIDADALKLSIPETRDDIFENCRNCTLLSKEQVLEVIDAAPTIEVDRPTRSQFKRMAAQLGYEPVVRCKECVYWTPRHVKMNDGTIRFYERNEGIVTIEKGINVGSYCKRFDDVTVHGYRDGEPCIDKTKAWCNQDDFCSYGERRENR